MLFHIAAKSDWDTRGGESYQPAGLAGEGFVHCSTASQLVRTANALFSGREDLLLITIEPSALTSALVWEDLYGAGEDFPHVYGPIDHDAIESVERFPPDAAGCFDWWVPPAGRA